ncbi:MAG: hypothetical protein IPM39_08655 [Chloroflexi bacterium]|nr:hypothetical protein [Chloroflexota bacterium]
MADFHRIARYQKRPYRAAARQSNQIAAIYDNVIGQRFGAGELDGMGICAAAKRNRAAPPPAAASALSNTASVQLAGEPSPTTASAVPCGPGQHE